jgi:hypothetical protein
MREASQGMPTLKSQIYTERQSNLARTGRALKQVLRF